MLKTSATRFLYAATASLLRPSLAALPLCTTPESEQPGSGTNEATGNEHQSDPGTNPLDPEEVPRPRYNIQDYQGLRDPGKFLSTELGVGGVGGEGGPIVDRWSENAMAGMLGGSSGPGEMEESYDGIEAIVIEHAASKELVDKYLGKECMSQGEIWKEMQKEARTNFQRHTTDTGSSEVQVAILTQRIKQMEKHMTANRKDFSSRRGLEKMLNTRRKLLLYLRGKNFDKYCETIGKLGLKDNYIRQDRFALYNAQKEQKKRSGH